ncbi:hypothetical protein ACSSS7_006944 [Eimeria intestinalis]
MAAMATNEADSLDDLFAVFGENGAAGAAAAGSSTGSAAADGGGSKGSSKGSGKRAGAAAAPQQQKRKKQRGASHAAPTAAPAAAAAAAPKVEAAAAAAAEVAEGGLKQEHDTFSNAPASDGLVDRLLLSDKNCLHEVVYPVGQPTQFQDIPLQTTIDPAATDAAADAAAPSAAAPAAAAAAGESSPGVAATTEPTTADEADAADTGSSSSARAAAAGVKEKDEPQDSPSTTSSSAPAASAAPAAAAAAAAAPAVAAAVSAPPRVAARQWKFRLDAFQQRSIQCLEAGENVLVAAHTSAGKTVVAEYAIAMALRDKQRVVYTSPIKRAAVAAAVAAAAWRTFRLLGVASREPCRGWRMKHAYTAAAAAAATAAAAAAALSNQKYRDLCDIFGSESVGLLTGDVSVQPEASIVVMTTEILRSMLYRGSVLVREVRWVVYDEIHYMRDRERGVVWEESIILLPAGCRLVFLSATIPNAKEFASWIAALKRQPCHVLYTEKRPTPLQHYMYPQGGEGVYLVMDEHKVFREGNFLRAVGALQQAVDQQQQQQQQQRRRSKNKSSIAKIVLMCEMRRYTPVIVFCFSKKECEANAQALIGRSGDSSNSNSSSSSSSSSKDTDINFTTEDERKLIAEIFQNAVNTLDEEDRQLPQVRIIQTDPRIEGLISTV